MFKALYYKLWLRHWAHTTTAKGYPNLHVKRRYEDSSVFIDIYWSVTDKNTGRRESSYDRIGRNDIVRIISRKDRHVIQRFLRQKDN